jgi:type II secretory pathway component GspD/PulD (secretin)
MRTYVPPDQLVSFLPSTPFDQFIQFLNPIFERVTGKQIIDPDNRRHPIGVSIAGLHFFDAFELVLQVNQLSFRETDLYFMVTDFVEPDVVVRPDGVAPTRTTAAREVPATSQTREIKIDAILFEVNMSKARELGLNWDLIFGDAQQAGTGGGTGTGTGGQQQARFFLRTERLFNRLDDVLIAPTQIEVSQLMRLLETTGIGQAIANPSVSVQSGQQGRIQIGSDIPIQVRDFAGNTVTQFVSTGIIINVMPTLLQGALTDTTVHDFDFIHLDVQVERSSARPFGGSVAVDRSTANTQLLFLNGEQTVIGGLYSTDETVTRRGIPILKDLPPWFFGLRYLFGVDQRAQTQRELLIALQVHTLDPLPVRVARGQQLDLRERAQQRMQGVIERFDDEALEMLVPLLKERQRRQR